MKKYQYETVEDILEALIDLLENRLEEMLKFELH